MKTTIHNTQPVRLETESTRYASETEGEAETFSPSGRIAWSPRKIRRGSFRCRAGADFSRHRRNIMKPVTLLAMLAASLAIFGGATTGAALNDRGDSSWQQGNRQNRKPSEEFLTTVAYVEQFYPLWFTYNQALLAASIAPPNRLVGPERISPLYQTVVAINNDTLYASSFLDLSNEPAILTIPPTTATYSILNLDPYGDISDTHLVAGAPGTYALIGPDWNWSEPLPPGATPVMMPLNASILIFRRGNIFRITASR